MDYSILVIVVDANRLPDEKKNYIEDEIAAGNIRILKSAKNPNYYYFVGIIDYFQLYDFQKRAERFLKSNIKCRGDPSS